ncbi:hypothetical protein ES703_77658 [subsurface metagenome]
MVSFCGVPGVSVRSAVEDGVKFVRGIPGRVSTSPRLSLYTPLTAGTSPVRSALLEGCPEKENPSCVSGKLTGRLDPNVVRPKTGSSKRSWFNFVGLMKICQSSKRPY